MQCMSINIYYHHVYCSISQIVGCAPWQCNVMLEGVWMPWGNRYTSRAFIDIDLIYSEFGVQNIFSSQERALKKMF